MGKSESEDIQKELSVLLGEEVDLGTPEKALKFLRELTEEEVFRLEHEKFRFFEPNGKCEEYIKAVGEGNFIVLFSAANGIGKTATSANIVAHLLWGTDSENEYFNLPMFKNFPYPKRGRIISDPTNVEKNLIPTLRDWFPLGRYTTNKGNKKYDSIWKTDNGWEFDIMTYEQDPKEFESTTLGWAWFDEPPPQSIFVATVSRMRKGGIIFISETPLYAAWLYDHIIANPDKDLAGKGQRVYIEADVEAACKQHGVRGHLEHAHIERMIAEYSEEEKQARIYGKFQHLIGLRFKQWNRQIHVVKPFDINPDDFLVYEALDPHPRNPDAVVWLAVDRKGRRFVVDELYHKCTGGTPELAERIKNKASQYRIATRVIDPSALIEDQHTGHSLALLLSRQGLSYLPATKLRNLADKKIEDALAFQKITANGIEEFIRAPELYVFDTCQRTIFEIEHYRWDEWTGKQAEKKSQREVTVDKDDHCIECLGRILVQEPRWTPMQQVIQADATPNYDPFAH